MWRRPLHLLRRKDWRLWTRLMLISNLSVEPALACSRIDMLALIYFNPLSVQQLYPPSCPQQ
jgi:hypothetical protein